MMRFTAGRIGRVLITASVVAVSAVLSAPTAFAQNGDGKLYWTTVSAEVRRSNFDGTQPELLFDLGGVQLSGLGIDPVGGRLYVTVRDAEEIWTAKLDGSDVRKVAANLNFASGMAVDPVGGHLYWTESISDVLRRSNLDGTGTTTLLNAQPNPSRIALDLVNRRIYWSTTGQGQGIRSADLTGGDERIVAGEDSRAAQGIAVDSAGGKFYWTSNDWTIRRADLDGSSPETIVDTISGAPHGIIVAPALGKIYWGAGGVIQRSNLDGTNVEIAFVAPGVLDLAFVGCPPAGPGDTDCDSDGQADACQLAGGVPDCNGNGILDVCDLAAATSPDCNGNAVPDECDLSSGDSQDCNGTSVPDECDITAGTSDDCNADGRPDECDPFADCNGNTIRDLCDVAAGTSLDCNFDEVPDECQPDEDCDTNGARDLCDIGSGAAQDCNDNLVPDTCDLLDGTLTDANGDGKPDECCFVGPPPLPDLILNATDLTVQSVKNRFLSFSVSADTGPVLKAVRVKIVDLWGPWAVLNGTVKWVGAPVASSEAGGNGFDDPVSFGPTFLSARLVDAPVFLDWTVFGVVHVWDEWIIPSRRLPGQASEPATYWIQTVSDNCGSELEESASAPLVITQALWGDIGSLASGEFRASDGDVGTADILALLAKFSNTGNAPSKTRAEMLGVAGGPVGTIDGVRSAPAIFCRS